MRADSSRQVSASALVDFKGGHIGRDAFVSEEIFQLELENLFARCWLFIGHESQIPNPGDFVVSRMGTDSVLMTRDNAENISVLLNSCRHRGMKVCRYDEGNTMQFFCPYHGWSYSVDGSLVSYPGELYGVPQLMSAYSGKLDKSAWGLIACPKVTNYRGLIFASWDPLVPSFEDYVGDFHYWLDNLADGLDGTPGGAVVMRGVQKWKTNANWKFAIENSIGDVYHGGPTHASVEAVGIGPGGKSSSRHGNRARGAASGNHSTSFPKFGHGSCGWIGSDTPYNFEAFGASGDLELRDYFKAKWEAKVAHHEANDIPLGATSPSSLFPSMSFHSNATPRTIIMPHPIDATHTELWRYYMIDKDTPDFVEDWTRHYVMRYSGPAGLTEMDDAENWGYATEASKGTIARRYDYNYEMGAGLSEPSATLQGAIESPVTPTEENARNYYRVWGRVTDGEDWASIISS